MYELPDGSWDMEREEADAQQFELEAAGRSFGRRMRAAQRAFLAGHKEKAAALCPHGWGYGLDTGAFKEDPANGQAGWRCRHCGSRLDMAPFEGKAKVTHPCEIAGVW